MLEKLREEISKFTIPLKSPIKREVTRVIVISTSPSLKHLQKWFRLWFPLKDKELIDLYKWIDYPVDQANTSKNFQVEINNILLKSFDVKLEGDLTEKGYKLYGSMNQIVILSDLTEEESLKRIETVLSTVKDLAKGRWAQIPIHTVGVFLIKKILNADSNLTVRSVSDFSNKMKSLMNNFDKIFLLDISNRYGTTIHEVTDLHFLMAHVVYMLLRKPIEFINRNDIGGFREWIKRDSPREGRFTGFSGETMVVPIDELIETILISKSGEVLEETLLKKSPNFNTYVDTVFNIIKKNHFLYSYESIRERFLSYPDRELSIQSLNIRGFLEHWDIQEVEAFIKTARLLDRKIPEYIKFNEKILEEIANRIVVEFKHGYYTGKEYTKGLYEEIEDAIINYQAGLLVAESSLEKLLDHLYEIGEDLENKPPVKIQKIDNLIEDLNALFLNAPSKLQVILRSLVLLTVAGLSFYFVNIPFLWKSVIFGVIPLFTVMSSVFKVIAYRDKIINKYEQIKNVLENNWNQLLEQKIRGIIALMLRRKKGRGLKSDLFKPIEELDKEVNDAEKRLRYLIDYFENKYFPETLKESSYWRNVLKNRNEFMMFKPLFNELYEQDRENFVNKFIPENMETSKKPLKFWKRFNPPIENINPNNWEWELAQNVGISLVPYIDNLLKISICRILKDYKPREFKNYVEILKRSIAPFILLKPGADPGTYIATLEIPSKGCEDIDIKIEEILKNNVHRLEKLASNSPYRISIVNLAEGLELEDLYLED